MEETIKYNSVGASSLNNGELAPILTEENYLTLKRMINSEDEGDHKIAQLTLNTCDIQYSIYWIWRLAKEGSVNNMVNLRTKASRSFRDKSSIFKIWSMSDIKFAEFLNRENWLTTEIFERLEKEIINALNSQCRNVFYSVNIIIKDQFKHLPIIKTAIQVK